MKLILLISLFSGFLKKEEINYSYLDNQIDLNVSSFIDDYNEYRSKNYFEDESIDEIAEKLDKYLNSTLEGKGRFITEYSISVGMDPYLAAAVMLQETGCYWNCSTLVKKCNNVGGNKGKPGCNGGSYRKFDTLEEGIKFAIDKLNYYYQKGLKTPKQINKYYAESSVWHQKVTNYINKLKNS